MEQAPSIMKSFFVIVAALVTFIPQAMQAQYFGGTNNDFGNSFCVLNENFYLAGSTRSFGEGSDDAILVRVNGNLEVAFHKEWGKEFRDAATKVIATKDNHVLVAGHTWNSASGITVFLAKYDERGCLKWTSFFGGLHNDFVNGLIEVSDGYLLTGINRAEGELGSVFLLKTNFDGERQWQQFYDTENKDIGIDVAECDDGDLMVLATTSSFVGKVSNSSEYISDSASTIMLIKTDVNGKENWRKFYGGPKHDFASRIKTFGGHFYISGSSLNETNGSFDATLYKIDDQGEEVWRRNYGWIGYEYGNDLDIDEQGHLLLTGTTGSFFEYGDPDVFVVKVDSGGNEIWSETYGSKGSDYGNGGQFLSNGNIGIIGSSQNIEDGDRDILFMRLSGDGEWKQTLDQRLTATNIEPVIFPNPVTDQLKIYLGDNLNHRNVSFGLYDLSGNVLMESEFTGPLKTIPISYRTGPGTYIYRIVIDHISYNGKVIIQ